MKNFYSVNLIIKPICFLIVLVVLYFNNYGFTDFEKISLFMLSLIYLEIKEM